MDRVVRLYGLWSWLPHFRAIAETEHLPTASQSLGLSPSALSRALKQLEEAVDCELFVRDGRTIRLNTAGESLLRAVRLAMRGIDDVLQSLAHGTIPTRLRVAAPGPFHGALFLELVGDLLCRFEGLSVELCSCQRSEVINQLCRGIIDICIHEAIIDHPDIETIELAKVQKVVVCAPTHALADRESVSVQELASEAFAAPPSNAEGVCEDGWPPGYQRQIRLTVAHMQTGVDACKSGRYLVVLPKPIVAPNGLCELPVTGMEPMLLPLYASTRVPAPVHPVEIAAFLDGLQRVF